MNMLNIRKIFYTFLSAVFVVANLPAQTINPALLKAPWPAAWIALPGAAPNGYGVYHFRKNLELDKKPQSFVVHVSADNRYKLFVNEKLVASGPARSDLFYWNYETIDLSPWLQRGTNAVSAIVWNEGEFRSEGQISNRTAFLLQGNSDAESAVNTNASWKVIRNEAYGPLRGIGYNTYYVAGPGEIVNMRLTPKGWMKAGFNDSGWANAQKISNVNPKGAGDISGWMLVPSTLPQPEEKEIRFAALRRSEKLMAPAGFPRQKTSVTVPANTAASLLLDQSYLVNAYPVFTFSKGNNANVTFTYAEALFDEAPTGPGKIIRKGNRNEVEGKFILGRKDSLISDGTSGQQFIPLTYRTFRYVQLNIKTQDEPLIIDDLYSMFTGYPFQLKSTFAGADPTIGKILEIGWRTARSCAVETYMDCPYYEQLQYIGDARIQSLVTLYNSGDDRIVRNAINQMDRSRIAEGITLSRHPSFSPQEIPTFSLWYVGMVHDFWMFRGDSAYIKDKLQGIRNVLWFYEKYQGKDGSLRDVPYWNFTDWVQKPSWKNGVAPIGKDGSSSLQDLQLLWALQLAADLETSIGMPALASGYKSRIALLKQTIQKTYWSDAKKLYADTKEKDVYSQHANTLAILTGMATGSTANDIARKLFSDTSLAPASVYFKYYLHQALVKAGLGNDYLKWLDIWKKNIEMGLTTWAEISEIDNARSDCHAWGASPNIEFFRVVLGINAAAPGFSKVSIEPHLGELKQVQGSIPHEKGSISADYTFDGKAWRVIVELPQGVNGDLVWKGKKLPLKSGRNSFNL
jgi:alpha-L-rhamnosidase